MSKQADHPGETAAPFPAATSVERIPVTVYPSSTLASKAVAQEIAELIRAKAARGEKAVLGLATGSTPTGVYDELIRLHKEEGLSFANVVTFNLDEFDNVELYEGLAEDVIPYLEMKPDMVLVDPPRAGLEKQVVDGILKMNPQWIAYVSCDPSTLGRDAARLIRGGYRLQDVMPFDLFPQTFHIESISVFER